jgi:hypothetical protein
MISRVQGVGPMVRQNISWVTNKQNSQQSLLRHLLVFLVEAVAIFFSRKAIFSIQVLVHNYTILLAN